jgi:trans-aconitate 2-methyltransferase
VSAPPTAWDAQSYDRQVEPHEAWGRTVLDRLDLGGDETVLDAGCGTGKITRLLLERLPRGRVIGVDASAAMVERAREALGSDQRVELRVGDLLELSLAEPVDAVFSSATFHWILEHDRLFARLYDALRGGGRLEAQCGGQGNAGEIERVLEALAGDERFSPYLRAEQRAWNFASVGDTELRLERAGFESARAWLEPWPVTPRDPRGFLATVILPWHFDRLPANLHEEFIDAILGTVPRPLTVHYVRLNISARKPAGA